MRARGITTGFLLLMASLLVVLLPATHANAQTILYASPGGAGQTCSLEAPCSLISARDRARAISSNMTANIFVYLRGGTYTLSAPLQFTAQDSGTNGYEVTYKAYPGETPLISGGRIVTGWSLFDASKNIYRAYVGDVGSRQFYINGGRAVRARGESNPLGFAKTPTGYATTNASMSQWNNQTDVEIVGYKEWKSYRCGVAQISGNSITIKQPCWKNSQLDSSWPMDAPAWIENAFELLDEEGEWYLNRVTGYLYYKPRGGEDISSVLAVLPVVESLFTISGSLDAPVHNMIFEGLTFEYTTWLAPNGEDGFCEVQANHTMNGPNANYDDVSSWVETPAGVTLTAAKSIRFVRDTFAHMGAAGLGVGYGCQENQVSDSVLFDISGNGLQVGGITVGDHHPTDPRRIVLNNRISGNFVHDIAVEYHGGVGIFVSYTDGTIISHNEVAYVPYTGISVGWGWGWTDPGGHDGYSTPTTSRNNHISYNLIHDCMRVLRDGGGVYTLGSQPGSTIDHNFIYGQTNRVAAIYLDEGSQGFNIYSNVITNAPHWLFFHLAQYNVAQRNFTDAPEETDGGGANNTEEDNLTVTNGIWPPLAQVIMSEAGLEIPVLLADNSDRAIALDSVTFKTEPFSIINNDNFSADQHTRVLLFARKVPSDTSLTVQAEDANHVIHLLTSEYAGKVPDLDWLTVLIVRLPDGLSGNITVSIRVGGVFSNKAFIRIH